MKRHLNEIKRADMINFTKGYSDARYKRRLNYSGKISHKVGPQELMETGNFSLLFDVGDYKAIVELKGMKRFIINQLKENKASRLTVRNLLIKALDNLDLGVYCTCADFTYRFHYLVSVEDSLPLGIPVQLIPAVKTNPYNQGFLCKHLTAILTSPSKWIPKATTLLREAILEMRGD